MTGRPPIITGALREELWRRYKAGETILGIGRALDQRQATPMSPGRTRDKWRARRDSNPRPSA